MRTPASAIIGALDVLRDSRLTAPQREMCDIISQARVARVERRFMGEHAATTPACDCFAFLGTAVHCCCHSLLPASAATDIVLHCEHNATNHEFLTGPLPRAIISQSSPNHQGSAEILTLVEDALSVGTTGDAEFRISPARTNLRRALLSRAWRTARLQRRYQEKVAKLRMEMSVDEAVPQYAEIDSGRAAQVITNLIGNAARL